MDVTIACPCPPKADGTNRHETDTVTLREKLDFRQALTIRKAVQFIESDDDRSRGAEVLATLSEFYLLEGVEAWTLVDERNKPLPVSHGMIRAVLFAVPEIDALIEAADGLYSEAILLPLLARARNSSPPSLTGPSTSARTASSSPRPTPSRRSSTTTSPTDGIGTITSLPVGASNSSPNSRSAG